MKVSELVGAELDFWVAKADGENVIIRNGRPVFEFDFDPERHAQEHVFGKVMKQYVWYQPSTDWPQGGPLIEKYKVQVDAPRDYKINDTDWRADIDGGDCNYFAIGESPLQAICRAVVRAKFGDEVDSPQTYQQEK